jgi:hypothetical protein
MALPAVPMPGPYRLSPANREYLQRFPQRIYGGREQAQAERRLQRSPEPSAALLDSAQAASSMPTATRWTQPKLTVLTAARLQAALLNPDLAWAGIMLRR